MMRITIESSLTKLRRNLLPKTLQSDRYSKAPVSLASRFKSFEAMLFCAFLSSLVGCDQASSLDSRGPSAKSVNASYTSHVSTDEVSQTKLCDVALASLEQGRPEEAWQYIQQSLLRFGQNSESLFVAARIQAARGKFKEAATLLDGIPISDADAGLPALGQSAEWLCKIGDLQEAERRLQLLVEKNPQAIPAYRLLVRIRNAQGRRWESREPLIRLFEAGNFRQEELAMFVDLSEPFDDPELRTNAEQFDPGHPYLKLSMARRFIYKNRYEEAHPLLEQACRDLPNATEPWVWLGHVLVETENFEELASWSNHLPSNCETHPQFWMVRGRWSEHLDDLQSAARCYVEALKRDPLHLAATQRLSSSLIQLGYPFEADQIRVRMGRLAQTHTQVQEFLRGSASENTGFQIAEHYRALGDPLLGLCWEVLTVYMHQPSRATSILKARLNQAIADRKINHPIDGIASRLPLEEWKIRSMELLPEKQTPSSVQTSQLRMSDIAQTVGLDAHYNNGGDVNRPGLLIFQGNGGGVAVLDADRDGWPDFYFSNAGGAPGEDIGHDSKSFYRSNAGKTYSLCTNQAYLGDFGYGQGVSAGDFDQDGFSDIVVANFGSTRLYRNQGDGTFEECFLPQPPPDESWATSVAIADIDGDALPEIIVGYYIAGMEVRTRACVTPGSDARNCQPNEFPPCANRLLRNLGNGSFKFFSNEVEHSVSQGRTLGVLVTNLDRSFGNEVFFANDVSPNYLLVSEPADGSARWRLSEQASRRGVAVDAGGRAQAYMGIACGDVDRNGLLDIAVTTFLNDTNTLYLQSSPGIWLDGTRRTKFHLESLKFLGFGCQFVDLDDDGWLDFVVLNGHIDDFSQIGTPYRMVPQIYQNRKGAFQWIQSDSIGEYFAHPALGRGLALVDFNRDHRIDLVATHLDRPAALLQNESSSSGNFIELDLIGVHCERDAIGAIVDVHSGEQAWTAAITSGDGYLCSSEKMIHIGLGSAAEITRIDIHWPDGTKQVLPNLEVNHRWQIVQGHSPTLVAEPE